MNDIEIVPTLFDYELSDKTDLSLTVTMQQAEFLMLYFTHSPLFNWADSNNGCEARSDAACILLEAWHVPHYKGWAFSGQFLKNHFGGLKQNWNYHVAPLLPVKENGLVSFYMIDPATSSSLQTLDAWAAGITAYAHSYHLIKNPEWYIFSDKKITRDNWNKRNGQNRKWMLQGLAGVNSLEPRGKAALVFNKNRIGNKVVQLRRITREKIALPGR
ncbi:MAG: protein-glutamine glutaminase family protein [Ferruginibacter sp.]